MNLTMEAAWLCVSALMSGRAAAPGCQDKGAAPSSHGSLNSDNSD